jgi:HAD superfamily hydrolase (TIGR01509 family)
MSASTPPSALAAVIFDLDGVLVDTEPLGFQVVNNLVAEYGLAMSWEEYVPIIGTTISAWDVLIRRHELPGSREEWSDRFWEELQRHVDAGQVKALPGVYEALTAVGLRGLKLGLASSSRRSYVFGILGALGVTATFEAVVCREDVDRGKPDPAPFLEAARRLHVEPANCLAIEDSPAGLAAARAAGMRALAVRTVYIREADLRGAERILSSLEDFTLADLLKL